MEKKYLDVFILIISAQNESLSPYYEIDQKFVDQKIKELVFRFNYTLNPIGVYEAIKYMYTYWPNPHNTTHMRDQYIHVSINSISYQFISIQFLKFILVTF